MFQGSYLFSNHFISEWYPVKDIGKSPHEATWIKNLMMTYVHLYTIYRSIVERTQPLNSKCMQGRIVESRYSETTKSSLARLFSDSPMETQDSICHLFVISYGSAHSKRTRH